MSVKFAVYVNSYTVIPCTYNFALYVVGVICTHSNILESSSRFDLPNSNTAFEHRNYIGMHFANVGV